jgi:hypothetical protein
VLGTLLSISLSAAADLPGVPCAGKPALPPYSDPVSVRTWSTADLQGWTPPACLRWPRSRFRLVVALAGRFSHQGGADSLLARFGAVSALSGLRYWSVTDKAWRVLITRAGSRSGHDFTAQEMKRGTDLLFEEEDSRSSGAVSYRMRVLESTPDRIVIETENVSPVKAFLMTLFPPGSLRASYVLERQAPGTWGFYGISATGAEASVLASASYINRAAALYRHFIGVPPDRDPPLAP